MRLSTDEGDAWCSVELVTPAGVTKLGADTLSIIRGRLLAALRGPPDSGPTQEGGPAPRTRSWVLSLSEEHASIYVTDEGGLQMLEIWDGAGAQLSTLSLDETTAAAWVSLLSKM